MHDLQRGVILPFTTPKYSAVAGNVRWHLLQHFNGVSLSIVTSHIGYSCPRQFAAVRGLFDSPIISHYGTPHQQVIVCKLQFDMSEVEYGELKV